MHPMMVLCLSEPVVVNGGSSEEEKSLGMRARFRTILTQATLILHRSCLET